MILENDKVQLLNTLYRYKSFGVEFIQEFDYNNLRIRKDRIELPTSFDKLTEFIEHCSLCELSKLTNKKNIGFGNSRSDIYFICDFVNLKDQKLMQLLAQFLNTLGVSFQEIYITNIIKCTVDLSKENKEKYCEFCKDYTLQQIQIKQPETILTFGESWRYFLDLGDDPICFAKEYQYNNASLFALHDLEFVYKNPSYLDDMEQYLKKIKRYLKGE
jgi:uracil-DNA glycosylase family 4